MADTDDEQTIALEPNHAQGDDDTWAASERHGARASKRDGERPAAVVGLTPEEEEARRQEELDQARNERIELAARDERGLEEVRERREVLDATAETTEAIRLAEIAESARDRYRRDAGTERRQATSYWAHGNHLLDEAAARPDEPGADATAAAGRRYQRAAVREDRDADRDDGIADRYDEEARERRGEAQPPASEAVRNPPAEAPRARKFVRKQLKQKVHDRSTQPDIGLGD